MGLFEGKTPAERNKTIAALVLGVAALLLVLRMFFGGDSPPPRRATTNTNNSNRAAVAPNGTGQTAAVDGEDPTLVMPEKLPPVMAAAYSGPDAARNIFAFPAVPVKTVATPAASVEVTPTPTPTPPLAVNSVSPANVFARTADFTLEVSGDKFTPQTRVFLDGQELPTTFKGAQQLSAQVPAALIGAQGARAVAVRTPDGALYSNTATINVMAPPTPQVTFVGLFGDKRYARDKAVLKLSQPVKGNDLVTLQRGELLPDGRFKVVNISERAVEFEDVQLKIKHTVPFTEARGSNAPTGPGGRMPPQPPQPPTGDDDDP
jgi:hypothetical protein